MFEYTVINSTATLLKRSWEKNQFQERDLSSGGALRLRCLKIIINKFKFNQWYGIFRFNQYLPAHYVIKIRNTGRLE